MVLMLIDLLSMSAAYWYILYRVRMTTYFISAADLGRYYVVIISCVFVSRHLLKVYRQIWRYASSDVYLRMVLADILGGLIYLAIDRSAFTYHLSFAHAVATVSVGLLATLSARFIYQHVRRRNDLRAFERTLGVDGPIKRTNVAIVGAGELGVMLAKELLQNPHARYYPTYFLDNDPSKIGKIIEGINVIGPDSEVIGGLHQLPIQEIILTLPNLETQAREKVFESYMGVGFKVLVYDYPTDSIDSREKRTIREVNIEDLLFREPVIIADDETAKYYEGKTILITGAGGSIGSELSRQLAKMKPARLVLLDVYENGVYDLGQELRRRYGNALQLNTVIASVCNRDQVFSIFEQYKPQVVFHAAAHKHVPLMEENCAEAITNNVFGTLNTVDAAEHHGVSRFLFISTDKAVNPTNIMGATKRLCEMIIQSHTDSSTEFAAVRFGNVLGSNGSVVPLFKKQIAEGGPVTITDKRIIRYFMTIPEAAQLVLRSGRRAERSEIYVLDMGKPVRIFDLAEKLIALSGLLPGKDIAIEEVGLRPGEKLYEELLVKAEDVVCTEENRIFIERSSPISRDAIAAKIDILRRLDFSRASGDDVRAAMRTAVPTYYHPEDVNFFAEQSEEALRIQRSNQTAIQPGIT